MSFQIINADITKLRVDAIVNAANVELQKGGGVCGAIFKAAGAKNLENACKPLAPIQHGEAVITSGFKLSKYIIHAAGPIYKNGKQDEEKLLRSCYISSLELALKYDCLSLAFPLISSGIFGYPKDEALKVATCVIQDFLRNCNIDVFLAVFEKEDISGFIKRLFNK